MPFEWEVPPCSKNSARKDSSLPPSTERRLILLITRSGIGSCGRSFPLRLQDTPPPQTWIEEGGGESRDFRSLELLNLHDNFACGFVEHPVRHASEIPIQSGPAVQNVEHAVRLNRG